MANFSDSAARVLANIGFWFLVMVLAVGISLLSAFPTKWILNYLLTPGVLTTVFGVAKLTFWRAFWLNYVSSMLFKSTTTTSSK
jgi:hypothetical protein